MPHMLYSNATCSSYTGENTNRVNCKCIFLHTYKTQEIHNSVKEMGKGNGTQLGVGFTFARSRESEEAERNASFPPYFPRKNPSPQTIWSSQDQEGNVFSPQGANNGHGSSVVFTVKMVKYQFPPPCKQNDCIQLKKRKSWSNNLLCNM